ncbi:NADH-quinone oxidoreductase subunit C [bacterium]|nr:NADH-quinone oxidoreductase subunit C [bacterium]
MAEKNGAWLAKQPESFKEIEKQLKAFYPVGELTLYRKRRWYWEVKPEDIVKVADFCFNVLGCRFSIATGTDLTKGFTITYHFSIDRIGLLINVRVLLPHDSAEIDSLTVLAPGFEWIERELQELLGIKFRGLEDTRHLLLPDDTPSDYHPLRRSFG